MFDLLKNIHWNGRTFGFDLLMINDHKRNQFYAQALSGVKDKVVLDIGAGTGLLSVLATQAGARLVYAFEYDPQNYAVTKKFIEQSGLSDRINLICADVLSIDRDSWPHEPIDVIITETFANDCFTENFAFLVEHVERNFNLSTAHRWIPESIDLTVSLVDQPPLAEFDPGVELPRSYTDQINQAVNVYRDHFYHKHNCVNLPVGLVDPPPAQQPDMLDSFIVDQNLKSKLDAVNYRIQPDWQGMTNPYLKIDWIVHAQNHSLWLNKCVSWRSIGFVIDKQQGKQLYLRFHPLTHALLASQNS